MMEYWPEATILLGVSLAYVYAVTLIATTVYFERKRKYQQQVLHDLYRGDDNGNAQIVD